MDYQDFVLQLDRAPGEQGLLTRVIRSPAGEAEAPFVNPVSPGELDRLWYVALEARQASRGDARHCTVESLSEDPWGAELSLEELGSRLFKALFRGSVRSCWARSLAEATQEPERGLRLKLQLNLADSSVASLAELPWEYLFSPEHGGFLGLQRQTPVLRHMRLPLPVGQPHAARPLRVLIVSSQPGSMPHLALAEEAEKIASTLGSLPGVETLSLKNPTIEILRETLLRQSFHVLHLMGHGGFDPETGQGVLYFAGNGGAAEAVSGALLAPHLSGLPSLRLVFINACETACTNARAPFAGVATALLRAGLPAVIAMQRPILDGSALEFSRTVYRRLTAGDPIDAAVTEGRLAIARGHGALLEWGTPVLFLRADDGRLFTSEPAPATATPETRTGLKRALSFMIVLACMLAVALGIWINGGDPDTDFTQHFETPDPRIVEEPTPRPETPKNEETPRHTLPSKPDPKPVEEDAVAVVPPHPAPPRKSSYELSGDTPVSIPELGAEVGARFFDRDGFSFARFYVAPQGEAMLEQPPIMGPGSIEFPSANGTYHLDVLSLDRKGKRATVRLRLVPGA